MRIRRKQLSLKRHIELVDEGVVEGLFDRDPGVGVHIQATHDHVDKLVVIAVFLKHVTEPFVLLRHHDLVIVADVVDLDLGC